MKYREIIASFAIWSGWMYFVDNKITGNYYGEKIKNINNKNFGFINLYFLFSILEILYSLIVLSFVLTFPLYFFSKDIFFHIFIGIIIYTPIITLIFVFFLGSTPANNAKGTSGVGICLPGDALIEGEFGRIRLDQIEPGNKVWSWSFENNFRVISKVYSNTAMGKAHLMKIVTKHTELYLTANHNILSSRGWKSAANLKYDDYLIITNKNSEIKYEKILKIERSARYEEVYRLVNDGENTFISEGFIMHNFAAFREVAGIIYGAFPRIDIILNNFRSELERRSS